MLTPKWWLLHLFVVAAALVMLRLGLWQWHRANSASGGIQNYAYAFQWPIFAGFAVVLWVKTVREEVRRDPDAERPAADGGPRRSPEAVIEHGHGVRVGISTRVPEPDDDDPEVAAYNARLAALNARAASVQARKR